MRLSLAAIHEFKDIYRDEFGEELSNADAEQVGLRLLRLFKLILETTPQNGHSSAVDTEGTHKRKQVR